MVEQKQLKTQNSEYKITFTHNLNSDKSAITKRFKHKKPPKYRGFLLL